MPRSCNGQTESGYIAVGPESATCGEPFSWVVKEIGSVNLLLGGGGKLD